MTFRPAFPPAAVEYIGRHMDEWPSVLAYNISRLFDYPCTDRGVRKQMKKIRDAKVQQEVTDGRTVQTQAP